MVLLHKLKAASDQLFNASKADDTVGVNKVSLDTLDEAHRKPVVKAILNILSTELAESTYCQIVDGLPLAVVYDEAYCDSLLDAKHPAYQHESLCPGVVGEARDLYSEFAPALLQFEISASLSQLARPSRITNRCYQVLSRYQAASPGSQLFNTLLVEITALSIHQIAVRLFNLDTSRHKADNVASWTPPKENESWWRFNPDGPLPTLFCHSWYTDYEEYPEGVADMVGFWAENRILGGVILFDRATPDSDAVYIHPDWKDVTYRICKLLDAQKQDLLDFLQSESPQCARSLPIRPNGLNLVRVDPEESIALTKVYRNIWERKPPPEYAGDERSGDVYDPLNFPTMSDQYDARSRWRTRFDRY
ncbi:hypothetical protein JX265_009610 [Neoarthrinium moseri]|uniref:Uncharacterized protein n=1 Tax=Neoarthrinium moseri TaxID=1658444 RepID=A0A9Q0ALK5_9PEZI|nr:hypothetical protein JX265_009610 [Neoarthrinium moseri]